MKKFFAVLSLVLAVAGSSALNANPNEAPPVLHAAETAKPVATTTVIGRTDDLKTLGENEKSLLAKLPDQGNPKANWGQNSGVLREEMNKGMPIRDASVGDNRGQFLNAERQLLQDRGWKFDASTKFWNPPTAGSVK